MNVDDLAQLGIEEGTHVEIRTSSGHVEVRARVGDLPSGLLFMPLGPAANALIGIETAGTGMPAFKGVEVMVVPVGGGREELRHA
jgi:formylmethanofuran dehydrogenase subunit D